MSFRDLFHGKTNLANSHRMLKATPKRFVKKVATAANQYGTSIGRPAILPSPHSRLVSVHPARNSRKQEMIKSTNSDPPHPTKEPAPERLLTTYTLDMSLPFFCRITRRTIYVAFPGLSSGYDIFVSRSHTKGLFELVG